MMAKTPKTVAQAKTRRPAAVELERTALDALVALLPATAVEVTPTDGLLSEARTNLPDGSHVVSGWVLEISGRRLVRATRQ